jgi:nucleoside-diphosphate-sugar epimerase
LTNTSAVADLYLLIFDKIRAGEPIDHGRTSLYFCENGEYVMHDLIDAITRALHSRGKLTTPTPTAFTVDEIKRYFPDGTMFGANSRCRADRSRAIGWDPKKGPEELLANVEEEIPN